MQLMQTLNDGDFPDDTDFVAIEKRYGANNLHQVLINFEDICRRTDMRHVPTQTLRSHASYCAPQVGIKSKACQDGLLNFCQAIGHKITMRPAQLQQRLNLFVPGFVNAQDFVDRYGKVYNAPYTMLCKPRENYSP